MRTSIDVAAFKLFEERAFAVISLATPCRQYNCSKSWKHTLFSYEVFYNNGHLAYLATLVPLLVPVEQAPPLFAVDTLNTFYLPTAKVVMILWNLGKTWTTFTKLLNESNRMHSVDFPSLAHEIQAQARLLLKFLA